jgi:hypothetical protein
MFGAHQYLVLLLGLLLFYLAFKFLAIPLLIKANQRLPARPKMRRLDLYDLDDRIARFLIARTEAMFQLGFDEPTRLRLPDPAPNVTTYLIMVVNRATGDQAMATTIVGRGAAQQQVSFVEFFTRFDSGEVFNTINTSELFPFPLRPGQVRTQVPTVRDPEELYRLHKFVLSRHSPVGKPELYAPGKAVEFLTNVFVQLYERVAALGWLYYDDRGDAYRPTFKGAYLMAWGLLQPFKALRQAAMQRRAAVILKEFDAASGAE